jgi:hypothetical protein
MSKITFSPFTAMPAILPGGLTEEGGMGGRWSVEGFGGTWAATRKPAEQ